jgi:hypothetical protein
MFKWLMFAFVGSLSLMVSTHAVAQVRGDPSEQILTRGPVHEAFAETVIFDPEPGIIVPDSPPAQIEERPPDQRPDGNNVSWIPGYWAWDDTRNDFIWISGVWRVLPPGREWVPGYWSHVYDGYQWIAGYWNDARATEVEYLPEPPQSIEIGPSVTAPSPDLTWVPGTWLWQGNHYVWRPGYWAPTHRDWEWVPAHYVWSPRGYVFVDGYWDLEVERRGTLFAPVYFEPTVYRRTHFVYSPTTVINLSFFSDSLFLRPRYSHYYFGDYYAPGWERAGFCAPSAFHKQYRGYDPIYAHQRWQHRDDRDWDRRVEDNYRYRRENAKERPPHTWLDLVAGRDRDRNHDRDHDRDRDKDKANDKAKQKDVAAAIFKDYARQKDSQVRYRDVDSKEKQNFSQHGQDMDRARTDREKTERADVVKKSVVKPKEGQQPPVVTRVKTPKSQIVGKSAAQLGKDAPPAIAQPPKTDTKVAPKARVAPPQPAHVGIKKPAEKPDRHDKPDKPEKKDKDKKP